MFATMSIAPAVPPCQATAKAVGLVYSGGAVDVGVDGLGVVGLAGSGRPPRPYLGRQVLTELGQGRRATALLDPLARSGDELLDHSHREAKA